MPSDHIYLQHLMATASYDAAAKDRFGTAAKTMLRRLAKRFGNQYGVIDPIRWNRGGIAVSGEVTLHADRVYVQVRQSFSGPDHAVLFRTCRDRSDYRGDTNNFAPMSLLIDTEALARLIESRCPFRLYGDLSE